MVCPKCQAGVLEPLGYIELKEGTLQLTLSQFTPPNIPALEIRICSKDPCGNVEIEAAPGSLTLAKRLRREALFVKAGNCL
jgi:hypothetical protein